MKLKVFLDCDVILDLLMKRNPFFSGAENIFLKIEEGEIQAYTSPLVFSNVFYILRKNASTDKARLALQKLSMLLKILEINEKILKNALYSEFSDFEDAIQYYTAKENSIPVILTRNIRDFKKAKDISIVTPDEYDFFISSL